MRAIVLRSSRTLAGLSMDPPALVMVFSLTSSVFNSPSFFLHSSEDIARMSLSLKIGIYFSVSVSVVSVSVASVSVGSSSATFSVIISILSGNLASGGIIRTFTPKMPGFSWTSSAAFLMYFKAGSPLLGRYPSRNFSYRALSVLSFPLIMISAPNAPASLTWFSAQKPALLKCTPCFRAEAIRDATTSALSSGISISATEICGFGIWNFSSRVLARVLMVSPPLPMTSPGRMT